MTESTAAVPTGRLAAGLGLQAVLLVAAGAAMWHYSGREVAAFVDFGWRPLIQGVAFGAAMIGVVATIFALSPAFLEATARLQANMAELFTTEVRWPTLVWISLCAGVGEEALFRSGVFTLASDHWGIAAGIAVSAVAFAVIHLAKPLIVLLIVLIGVVFGLVYWWTGSLLTVMIGHAVYDVWALRTLHGELLRLGYLGAPAGDPIPNAS